MSVIPNIIETVGRGERMYDVYSRLLKDRIIFLGTEINSEVANTIISQLLLLDSQNPDLDIQIYINSPGGEIYGGLAIYDTMQHITAPVSTICIGRAMSMGATILMAGRKGHRMALPHSRIMIHQGSSGFQGSMPDIAVQAEEIINMRRHITDIYVKHTNRSFDEIMRDMERDLYMTPQQALEYGLIDEIIPSNKLKT